MTVKNSLKMEDVLTPGQIAKYCKVDPRTVNRWISQGVLKSYALPITRYKRIRVIDFINFLKEQSMPIPSEFEALGRYRVLIVEDEVSVAKLIKRMLQNFDGNSLEIQSVTDGFDAGRVLERFRPDLVILDLMMPKMDGFEVCRRIKKDPGMRSTKVLILSGHINDENRKRVLDLGAQAVLEKPIESDLFKQKVIEILKL